METEGQQRREPARTELREFVAGNWFWLFFLTSIGVGLLILYFLMTGGVPEQVQTWQKFLYYFIPIVGFALTLVVFVTILWRDSRKGKR